MPPKRLRIFFVLQKTDFRTNWPTPQVVITQNAFSFRARSRPLTMRLCPWTPWGSAQTTPLHVPGARSAVTMWPPNNDPRWWIRQWAGVGFSKYMHYIYLEPKNVSGNNCLVRFVGCGVHASESKVSAVQTTLPGTFRMEVAWRVYVGITWGKRHVFGVTARAPVSTCQFRPITPFTHSMVGDVGCHG